MDKVWLSTLTAMSVVNAFIVMFTGDPVRNGIPAAVFAALALAWRPTP